MKWSGWIAGLFSLFLLISMPGCGPGSRPTPTPIIIIVTPVPGQPEATVPPEAPTEPAVATGEPVGSPAGIEIVEAVFAHGLSAEMEPVDPGSDFGSTEPVYLSVEIRGRPEEGQVTAHFHWFETPIAEATVNLADANSGLVFSIGENTFAGYTLSHEDPFPVGTGYRADLTYGDEALGSYEFRIVPPVDAVATQINEVVLARGADEDYRPVDPTTVFAPDETVFLVGRGDLGLESWLQAEWYAGGALDESATRSITMEENASDVGFAFSFLPEEGWSPGENYVVLTVNGKEIGRYPFTIASAGGSAEPGEAAFWSAFPLPENSETVPVAAGYDLGVATDMVEPQFFDWYADWLQDQGWSQQAPAEAMQTLPHQVWRKDGNELLVEVQGMDAEGRIEVWFALDALNG